MNTVKSIPVLDRMMNMKKKLTSEKRRVAQKAGNFIKVLFRTLFLIGMGYVLLFPVLFLLSNAFRAPVDFTDSSVIWIPKHYTLKSITYGVKILEYGKTVFNTVKIILPSVILSIFSCMAAGYGFARFKFKGKSLLFGMVLFTIVVPVQTIIIPMYANFRYFDFFGLGSLLAPFAGHKVSVNVLNTPWSFFLPAMFGMGIRSGLFIYIFRSFFRGMPVELEEAAKIDGCNPFMTFWRVMVPNAKVVILTVLLFSVVWYWNDFFMSVMFYDQEKLISPALATIMDKLDPTRMQPGDDINLLKYSILEAGCLLVVAPIVITYIVTQKYFTESIERTGIVG